MDEMRKMCDIIKTELDKISEKGLTSGNLDTSYKLIDMLKDLKNIEYWETKGEYYEIVKDEMRGGRSGSIGYYREDEYSQDRGSNRGGRRRDSMGQIMRNSYGGGMEGMMPSGHSRNGNDDPYSEYITNKQSYRSGDKSMDCKQRMLAALQEHLDQLGQEIGELSRDSDCREERETLNRFIDKLKRMM